MRLKDPLTLGIYSIHIGKWQQKSSALQHAGDSTAGLTTENTKIETVSVVKISGAQAQSYFTEMLTKLISIFSPYSQNL